MHLCGPRSEAGRRLFGSESTFSSSPVVMPSSDEKTLALQAANEVWYNLKLFKVSAVTCVKHWGYHTQSSQTKAKKTE
jgi:hypothetical protein